MQSLVSFCAHKVVSDHASIRHSMDFIPKELYPVLFRAAFFDKKTLVLQDLVHRWPFSVLSFQKLLQCDRRNPTLLRDKPSKLCVQTVILGVMAYLSEALAKENGGSISGMRQLQLLDMTGMQDDGLEREPDSMSLWSSTVALSKACIDISRRHSENVLRMTKRRKGSRDATFTPRPLVSSVFVEVRVDLFVNSTSYGVLREALLISSHSPLRFQCRDLRAEELSLQSTAGLLELLNPAGVRKIDLRFNNLGLPGLNVLLPLMTKFTWLKSLKLPYSNIDIKRLSPEMEEGLQTFTSQIGQLRALQELNLGSSRLSGRLRQLLGGLQTPLESLELAFCYLLPMDLYYLSKSVHVFTLKKIDLSGNNLSEILLQPFLQLLTEVSPTLMHLDIMECRLADAHLSIIMPALCRCLCLRYIGFASNPVSSQGLKTFLQNSVRLPELQQVVYPFPVDCFSDDIPSTRCTFAKILYDEEKVKQVAIALQEMLVRAQRSDIVWTTDMYQETFMDYLNY